LDAQVIVDLHALELVLQVAFIHVQQHVMALVEVLVRQPVLSPVYKPVHLAQE